MNKNLSIPERYVDIKTVSRYASLEVNTMYEWSAQWRIPSIKIGRRVLYDLRYIDKVTDSLKRPYLQHDKTVNKIIGDLRDGDI